MASESFWMGHIVFFFFLQKKSPYTETINRGYKINFLSCMQYLKSNNKLILYHQHFKDAGNWPTGNVDQNIQP